MVMLETVKNLLDGKILYSSAGGNGTLTLNETILNFKYATIFYTDGSFNGSLIVGGNGTWGFSFANSGAFGSPTYYALRVKSGYFTLSGTSLTVSPTGSNYTIDLKNTGTFVFSDTATIWYVTKVVGYR